MSLGVDFDRYQFDRRLKELQDKVLSLNYRIPQTEYSTPQHHPQYSQPTFPQYIQPVQTQRYETDSSDEEEDMVKPYFKKNNNIVVQKSKSSRRMPNQDELIYQQRMAQQQWLDQMNSKQKENENRLLNYIEQQNLMIKQLSDQMVEEKKKKEQEEQSKKDELQRQMQLQKIEENLVRRQQHLLQEMKNDILDSLSTVPQYSQYYDPYNYQYMYSPQYYNQQPLQQQAFNHSQLRPPPQLQKMNRLNNGMQKTSNFSQIGTQSMRKIDHLLNSLK